ncbi:hypothetical protein [Salinibacter phage 4_17]
MIVSFDDPCPKCGAPTTADGSFRRCPDCGWTNRPDSLFPDTDPDPDNE